MDIEQARFNMVEQQIRTWNVLETDILDLLFVVKREAFVPPANRTQAFTDTEIPLTVDGKVTGETMLAPKVEARLLQDLHVLKTDSVLEVGAGTGYMAALLAARAKQVVTLEIRPELAKLAAENLKNAGVQNATVIAKDGANPAAAIGDAKFDVIVLSGSVPFVPQSWLDRLNPGGRLAAIVGELPVMTAQIFTRAAAGSPGANPGKAGATMRVLFDTATPPLQGFPQKEHFHF